MCNATTRLAIEIDHLPPYDFSWEDCTPQKMRDNLTLDVIFPNVEDGRILFERAVQHTAQILVEELQAVCGDPRWKFRCAQVQSCPNETSV